jgi:hypothetical protein
MMARPSLGSIAAAQLQALVRARGSYAHVCVRARGTQLLIETEDGEGGQEVLARASPLGGAQYGLSFRSHTGRWDPLPVQGTLEEIAQGLISLLGPYLEQENLT